ncbi:Zinc finger with UFM1-specific peptidase domain protein [Sphaceloma murrayae]|uniref:Zinc finger with UFM1-specific peptidase domain protein n=1 Tax=Sphaceloma murrayae TaxID=2082308 RepID=A0A2K1QS18_9PEZI|nr:Zinc finger with UFM1-specific peptidase domain protein [Sphaceloma murrayae]
MSAAPAGYGRRGHNRRSDQENRRQRSSLPAVPSHSEVVPGAAVSIVLKADQPTGREVQGSVRDVLTRHDHPRGVKVRLSDGRVGRVQRMVASFTATPTTTVAASVDGSAFQTCQSTPSNGVDGLGQRLKYRDIRLDDEAEEPPTTNDLSAYIKPAKQKKRRAQPASPALEQQSNSGVRCPVCNEFEGDEAAVAHHVQRHFD